MVNKKRPRALIMLLAVIGVILAGAQCVGNRPHHVEDRSTTGSAVAVGLESDAAISVVFMMLWVAAEAGRGMLARALGTVGGTVPCCCTDDKGLGKGPDSTHLCNHHRRLATRRQSPEHAAQQANHRHVQKHSGGAACAGRWAGLQGGCGTGRLKRCVMFTHNGL